MGLMKVMIGMRMKELLVDFALRYEMKLGGMLQSISYVQLQQINCQI